MLSYWQIDALIHRRQAGQQILFPVHQTKQPFLIFWERLGEWLFFEPICDLSPPGEISRLAEEAGGRGGAETRILSPPAGAQYLKSFHLPGFGAFFPLPGGHHTACGKFVGTGGETRKEPSPFFISVLSLNTAR